MDLEWNFAFLSYGQNFQNSSKCRLTILIGTAWREKRKLFHSQFQESVIAKSKPMQAKAAHDVVREIIASPQDLFHHIHMYVPA